MCGCWQAYCRIQLLIQLELLWIGSLGSFFSAFFWGKTQVEMCVGCSCQLVHSRIPLWQTCWCACCLVYIEQCK